MTDIHSTIAECEAMLAELTASDQDKQESQSVPEPTSTTKGIRLKQGMYLQGLNKDDYVYIVGSRLEKDGKKLRNIITGGYWSADDEIVEGNDGWVLTDSRLCVITPARAIALMCKAHGVDHR